MVPHHQIRLSLVFSEGFPLALHETRFSHKARYHPKTCLLKGYGRVERPTKSILQAFYVASAGTALSLTLVVRARMAQPGTSATVR